MSASDSELHSSPLALDANKYSRGVVAIVAGSAQFAGAGVLCVAGARRGGAGYIRHISPDELTRTLVLQRFPDVVTSPEITPAIQRIARAYVVGPGTTAADAWLVQEMRWALQSQAPVVVDGGGLAVLVEDKTLAEIARSRDAAVIITPHSGEAKRMGLTFESRPAVAIELAQRTGAVVVLKGQGTLVATADGIVSTDTEGGPELATAGTGDLLAGLLGSMLAAHGAHTAEECARVATHAVSVHSRAGNAAAKRVFSVTALDVAEDLARVMRGLRE
jgi:hydroxyethylthiazole kinase-like uncharacterized protein yjeF